MSRRYLHRGSIRWTILYSTSSHVRLQGTCHPTGNRSLLVGQEKPPMADDVFKNIQVLRRLTVDQFMGRMGFITAALSMNCSKPPFTFCNSASEQQKLPSD